MRNLLGRLLFSSALLGTSGPLFSACLPPLAPQPLYADLQKPRVLVTQTHIVLNQAIFFEFDRDRILPVSYPILDELAHTLRDNPAIARVRIEGHTDNVGAATYNLDLSRRRARAVLLYLLGHGLSPGRLLSVGFGQSQPIARNDTEDGRAQNRRVTFVIEEWQHRPGPRQAQR
jgi:outer membrane protein OmpA-like peptidoglycan-associated protein